MYFINSLQKATNITDIALPIYQDWSVNERSAQRGQFGFTKTKINGGTFCERFYDGYFSESDIIDVLGL